MASGEPWRGGDQQTALPPDQEQQRERAVERGDGVARGPGKVTPGVETALKQHRHGLGVGVGVKPVAARRQIGAQFAKVLDDPVVDHGDRPGDMGMRVAFGGRAMGRPAGVAAAPPGGPPPGGRDGCTRSPGARRRSSRP